MVEGLATNINGQKQDVGSQISARNLTSTLSIVNQLVLKLMGEHVKLYQVFCGQVLNASFRTTKYCVLASKHDLSLLLKQAPYSFLLQCNG
jgi:hypothetical protein